MTSLEMLWAQNPELMVKLWQSFNLLQPVWTNDVSEEERAAILAAISQWPSKHWENFAGQVMWIHDGIGRRLCEDILGGIREIEESKMNEIQEQGDRNLSVSDREEG
jgi:hypothetical protein